MTTGPVAHLARLVEADPDAVAIWEAHDAEPVPITRAELWQRSVALREDLRTHGVGSGDCVAVWLPNWSDTVVWQFAAVALGAHVIGVNTRYGVEEVAHVLQHARPRVLAVAHGFLRLELDTLLRAAVETVDAPPPSVAVLTGPGRAPADAREQSAYDVGGGTWVPSATTPETPDPDALTDRPEELFVAFTTSGSTGRPKLAAHTGAAVAAHSTAVAAAGDWDERSVTLLVLPWSGVLAYNPGMAGLLSGGALLMLPAFDADRALDLMESCGVTHLTCADDVSGRLMRAWQAQPRDLSAFRRLLIGDFYGESGRIAEWTEAETGATVVGIYGSSEIFALTGFWSATDALPLRHRAGGRLVTEGMEVRSVDPVTGEPTDGPGELQFRGPSIVDAYLGDDGTIADGVRSRDGWFCTGDLGTAPGDGTFVYHCRMGDSLRLKGFLVEPAEIESRLIEHEAVELVKVVGLDTAGQETRAVAFVVPRPGTSPEPADLRAWCAETLARFKVPDQVHVIETMPMTAGTNGAKIRAVELRELAKELAAAGTEGEL